MNILKFLFGERNPDTREPYLRDKQDGAIMLKVEGRMGKLGGVHERYIHNRIPHQNPVIEQERVWVGSWLFGRWETRETRYYPITVNGRSAIDAEQLASDVDRRAKRRGEDVSLVVVDAAIEDRAVIRENIEQHRRNNVPFHKLPVRNGRIT